MIILHGVYYPLKSILETLLSIAKENEDTL